MANIDNNIVKIFDTHKTELKNRFRIESLSVFGSVSRGTSTIDSDIDILVRYQRTPGLFAFLDLKQYLETIIGRPVDLVTEGALKTQLREKILKEAVRVA